MRRIISTVALTSGLALAGIFLAPAANADVTNPADNPSPITVTGDDGLTYSDGLDTLPGYDDYACTYIPGAYFDFDNNKVRYADGQSISWTEWDRATGYKAWLAKKATAPAPAPAPAAAAPAPATTGKGSTTTSNTSTGAKTTGATSGSAVLGVTSPSGAPSASASPEPTASPSPVASAGDSASPSATKGAVVLAEGAGQDGAGSGGPAGASAGLAILGGLFGIGGLAFGGYAFTRRGARGKAA